MSRWQPRSQARSAASARQRLDDEFETLAPVAARSLENEVCADEEGPLQSAAPVRSGPSLKARAVGYLSRREHSRAELARKLQPYAQEGDDVDAILDALQKEGWQSNTRFAQSLVNRRAARQGTARIVQELRQSGVDDGDIAELRDQLRETEHARALEVWRRRFDDKPQDRQAYAKQARFLAGRGFSHDVIRRILGGNDED
ncbi:recombination regulator RecX [Bordetella trematum]|uniref:Regulatory protein RecX n=1 Tax=Bordetella trematum TaxID=123899 RepID=A0A157SUC3_9BORD|nr:recombination regulator RecX [Bordetella trematum]AZR94689.1 recombination regulator RecX [Bordetella trematum]NNH19446.1 recombination regulator RecX [Bordetella trematum]QIM73188.1 recombination regulator RecX [Bordetella trematum]SAH99057.1 RecX family regulatory protein [Bordetella trematum]SAI74062.1 RecX family regulatory protein [Bordetella trematum]